MLDPKKPLRFINPDDKRPITLIGVMPNGHIVATSFYTNGEAWGAPEVFNPETGLNLPRTLRIENAPVVDSGFYPLDVNGRPSGERGLIAANMCFDEYPLAGYALEIIRVNGVPTEAKIHARSKP